MGRYFICLILSSFFILSGCTGKNVEIKEDLTPKFNKAMKFFNKGKYSRAREDFEYIILMDPGSKLANDSHYYTGESLDDVMDRYNKAEEFIEEKIDEAVKKNN